MGAGKLQKGRAWEGMSDVVGADVQTHVFAGQVTTQ